MRHFAPAVVVAAVFALSCKSKSRPEPEQKTESAPAVAEPAPREAVRADLAGPTTAFGPAPLLERFDENGDGRLDKEEIGKMKAARLETVMRRLDLNGDGLLTKTEVESGGKRHMRLLDRWKEVDVNGDDNLDASELNVALERGRRPPKAPKPAPPATER